MDPLGKATGSVLPSSGVGGGGGGGVYSTAGINNADGKLGVNVTTGGTVASSAIPGTSTALTGVTSRAPISGQSSFHHSTNVSTAAAAVSGVTASTANERAYV